MTDDDWQRAQAWLGASHVDRSEWPAELREQIEAAERRMISSVSVARVKAGWQAITDDEDDDRPDYVSAPQPRERRGRRRQR